MVLIDEPCAGCGYNLRGLAFDGACPECGRAVAASARGNGWAAVPSVWRSRLWAGASRARWAMTWVWLGVYPSVLGSVWGVWALTTPRPDEPERWAVWKKRFLARWLVAIGGVGSVLSVLVGWGWVWRVWTSTSQTWWWWDGVLIATHSAYALGLVLLFEYLSRLAESVPDGFLIEANARVRRTTMRVLIAMAGLGLAAVGLQDVMESLGGWWPGALSAAFMLGVVGAIAWWLWVFRRWTRVLAERLG